MENYLKIEDLIDGNLLDENLEQIKSEVFSDQNLRLEFEFRNEVNLAIRDKNFAELRELLSSQLNDNEQAAHRFRLQRDILKTWHLAAASFSLIVVVGGLWYILSTQPHSSDRLVSKYYKPAQAILQLRSIELKGEDALKEAFQYYQQDNYASALVYFNTLENQIIAKFYSGICYIELGQYAKAIESFEFVINDADNLFVEQAEWYLGLIYLMNNQKTAALDQFAKISESDSYYSNQAREIIRYLN